MKLWEAMLLGASMRPNTKYVWWWEHGSCAAGAALEGAGVDVLQLGIHPLDKIHELWPWTKRHVKESEMLDGLTPWVRIYGQGPTIADQIHHHHCHGNSRERIAREFIKPLEEAQADAILPCAQETPERVRA